MKFSFIRHNIKGITSGSFDNLSLFVPGVVFLVLGVLALVAPKLLGAVVAALFLSLGLIFCFVTWKLLRFKRKFDEMFRGAGKQFVIRTVTMPRQGDVLNSDLEDTEKKIIIH